MYKSSSAAALSFNEFLDDLDLEVGEGGHATSQEVSVVESPTSCAGEVSGTEVEGAGEEVVPLSSVEFDVGCSTEEEVESSVDIMTIRTSFWIFLFLFGEKKK